MYAGVAQIDITPSSPVWMEGMIRSHPSVGVHDPLFARALVLGNSADLSDAFAVVSLDLCVISRSDALAVRRRAAHSTGMLPEHIVLAATHTHSGPATIGILGDVSPEYVPELSEKLVAAIDRAAANLKPAAAGCASGREETISRYRRFLDENDNIVMIWEGDPEKQNLRCTGEIDPEVGVMKIADAEYPDRLICLLFNHAGHPNVMSGDSYEISADYPGVAERMLEAEFGCPAMFVNGAQGTMDIDNWKYRDWDGMEHLGGLLARAVSETARAINPSKSVRVRGCHIEYALPARRITDTEWKWARWILRGTGGGIQPQADGVGDDFKAVLYKELCEAQDTSIPFEQVCLAVDDTAFISMPCELFTEIGMRIKARSPFQRTHIIGLANGYAGYIPTREAIAQGGYEVETRRVDDDAEEIIVERSLALLEEVMRDA